MWWWYDVRNGCVWVNQTAAGLIPYAANSGTNWIDFWGDQPVDVDPFTPTNHITDFVIDQTSRVLTKKTFVLRQTDFVRRVLLVCRAALGEGGEATLEYICDRKPGHTWWTGCKMNFASKNLFQQNVGSVSYNTSHWAGKLHTIGATENWELTWPVPKVLKVPKTEPNISKQLISLGPSI